jgi:hypothetical protein
MPADDDRIARSDALAQVDAIRILAPDDQLTSLVGGDSIFGLVAEIGSLVDPAGHTDPAVAGLSRVRRCLNGQPLGPGRDGDGVASGSVILPTSRSPWSVVTTARPPCPSSAILPAIGLLTPMKFETKRFAGFS